MTAPAVFWNFEMAWQMFFCSCLGVLSLSILDNLKDGESIVEIVNSGAVKFGTMVSNPWYLWDLPSFMLLGVFGGILGAFFVSGNHFFGKLRKRFLTNKPKKVIETTLIVAITATIIFFAPAYMSN